MAKIELVIKMPEEVYKSIINGKNYISYQEYVEGAIKNGAPLPKGHGDLIDISNIDVIELEDSLHILRHIKGDEVDAYISAQTIIEADKTESEG